MSSALTKTKGRRQGGRAEESQQDHAQGHPQNASDDERPLIYGVGHAADQGIEPRGGQHAEADADLEPLSLMQICDEVRSCRLDKSYKADIKRVTLNIVSPEKRLLVF